MRTLVRKSALSLAMVAILCAGSTAFAGGYGKQSAGQNGQSGFYGSNRSSVSNRINVYNFGNNNRTAIAVSNSLRSSNSNSNRSYSYRPSYRASYRFYRGY